jgi:hypothetical protein
MTVMKKQNVVLADEASRNVAYSAVRSLLQPSAHTLFHQVPEMPGMAIRATVPSPGDLRKLL